MNRFNFSAEGRSLPIDQATEHLGFQIVTKRDLNQRPCEINGLVVKEGYEATYRKNNPLPGRAWFLTIEEARAGVDLLMKIQGRDAWWRLADEIGLRPQLGDEIIHRGYVVRQRVVCVRTHPAELVYMHGYEVFLPRPLDWQTLIPAGCWFETVSEAVDAVDLYIECEGFEGAFWPMVWSADSSGMIRHGASLEARQRSLGILPPGFDQKFAQEDAPRLVIENAAGPQDCLPAGMEGDYRGFLFTTWNETDGTDIEDRRTRIWSSELELELIVLEGAVTLQIVRAVVDGFYLGLNSTAATADLNEDDSLDGGTDPWKFRGGQR